MLHRLSDKKTQQTAKSKPSNQAQDHETTCCLSFIYVNPIYSAHHAGASNVAVRNTKQKLYNNQVKEIAVDLGAIAVKIA